MDYRLGACIHGLIDLVVRVWLLLDKACQVFEDEGVLVDTCRVLGALVLVGYLLVCLLAVPGEISARTG